MWFLCVFSLIKLTSYHIELICVLLRTYRCLCKVEKKISGEKEEKLSSEIIIVATNEDIYSWENWCSIVRELIFKDILKQLQTIN